MKVKFKKITSIMIVILLIFTMLGSVVNNTFANSLTGNDDSSSNLVNVPLSSVTPTAKSTQNYFNNVNSNGNKLGLLKNGEEVTYDSSIATVPYNNSYASVYFIDVQENGYLSFESDIGIDVSARNGSGKVEFKVYADGKQVYTSGEITSQSEAQHISIDLQDVEVLQLVVDALGSNQHDIAVWGDAHFTKNGNAPYLAVDDLEFNLKEQVTKENILEYVIAKDLNGNDITDRVTYKTNYNGQESGNFYVTYTVQDTSGNTHSRTVDMVVTGEDYTKQLSIERLKKPWASYLYHGRGTLSTQGKKAWDLILGEILKFDVNKWELVNRWGENVYLVDVDLQANNIFTTKEELNALGSMFMDDEPRTFIVKDWGCEITTKDGLASHVKMWLNQQALKQDEWLQKIETNTQNMLSEYKEDMTEAQRLYYVSNKYKNWLKYGNNGQLLSDSLGNGTAVCGGNARGYIYLSQRLGSKSVWGRSGSHAWSFTKLVDTTYWFKTDLLSGEFLAPGKNGEGNLSVGGNYKSRHYKWFDFGTVSYPTSLLRYPSVWVDLASSKIIIPENTEYDLYSYITDFGSIFNENITKESIQISVDKVDENGDVIKSNISSFPYSGNSNNLKAGYYNINYFINDNGKTNSSTLNIRVTGESAVNVTYSDRSSATERTGSQNELGLWDGSAEKWYKNAMYINDGGSVSFNVENKNYKYLSYDFGIKDSVRKNTSYGSYGKVAAKVEVTTNNGVQILYEGATLGWKTKYESILVELPEDAITVTIYSLNKGNGNSHAGVCDVRFYKDSGLVNLVPEENPPKLSSNEITIYDNVEFDPYSAFLGIDEEDGEFVLTTSNFTIDKLEKVDDKYVSGTHSLNYQLVDKHGNITTGVITVNVIKTEDEVQKAQNQFTISPSIKNWKVDEKPSIPTATALYGEVIFTYSDSENGTFTDTVPTNAGTYYLKARVEETDSYTGIEEIVQFTINKADTNIEILKALDKNYDGQSISLAENDIIVTGSDEKPVIEWYIVNNITQARNAVNGSTNLKLDQPPTNVGNYKVVVTVSENENYNECSIEKEFTINKATNNFVIIPSISNWTYNQMPSIPQGKAEFGDVVFTYSDKENGIYTENVPTDAGIYYLKARVEGTDNYTELVRTIKFEIEKAQNSFLNGPSIANWKEGENPSQPIAIAVYGTPVFTYSNSLNGDYTSTVPTKAGTWYMKARVEESNNYYALEKVVEFNIESSVETDHKNCEWIMVDEHTHNKVCKDCNEIIETSNHEFELIGKKDPTHTENGYTGDVVCKQCGYVSQKGSEIPKLVIPTIIEGQNLKWDKNTKGNLLFRSDANFNQFIEVLVDGKVVDPSNYNLREGSIIVELKEEFLNTLSNGVHTMSIKSTGGEAVTNFTIENLQANTNTTITETSDNLNILVYLIVLLISGVCLYVFCKKREQNN